MVFESIVAGLLNKYLGEYVENLDTKQLNIGIWGGDVVLHNLKIRNNALDDLHLPVQLVYGYLGKLILKIPWKNIYKQPVIAQIEDFYALVTPKQSVPYDAEKEELYELQTKQAALAAIDEAHRQAQEIDKPKADPGLVEKMSAQIINNLQVKIANVHLRYEDTTTTGSPFSCGVSLYNLELYTTDENWVKCYLTEQVREVLKLANLDSLSVYMNCSARMFSIFKMEEMSDLFRSNIANKETKPASYTYVLGPISSVAKLRLNMNPEFDDPPFVAPKINLSLEMEKLNVGITSTQFKDMMSLLDTMNRMTLGLPYRQYRPFETPYKGNYKLWWKFAITSVLNEQVRKKNRSWTWEHIREHRNHCNAYSKAYKERVLTKNPPAALVEQCTLLEKKLDIFNLIMIRRRLQIEIDKIREKEAKVKETEKKAGWFSGWFSSAAKENAEDTDNIVSQFEAAMTPEEKQKFYTAIGYQENTVPLQLPEHYVATTLNFKLVALEIGLYDDSLFQKLTERSATDWDQLQTVMLLRFSMATCRIEQRPAADALSVTAEMKELKLTGLNNKETEPTIIESLISDEHNLLDIFYETNPLDKRCDKRIKVIARPLQIVLDADTVLQLMKVFAPPPVNLSEIEGAASLKMANFKERSATGMQYMIDSHAVMDVNVLLMPNLVIIPLKGKYLPNENSQIVLGLGQLSITSEPHKELSQDVAKMFSSGKKQEEIMQKMMAKAYDHYKVSIEDVQILVVKPQERWEDVIKSSDFSELYVLRPTTLIVDAEVCVVDDDPRLPKTKVEILLPAINLNLTENRILEALRIATSIELSQSSPMVEQAKTNLVKSVSSAALMRSIPNFLLQDEKRKSQAADPLVSEVVQYTNLEVTFALNELNITLLRSCGKDDATVCDISPIDSNAYVTPDEDMPDLKGVGKEFSADTISAETEKLMSLQILRLEMYMAQRTFEMVTTAKLGAISLRSFEVVENEQNELVVVETPRYSEDMQYLLTVAFTAVDKTTPDFTTKYKSTEQLIEVNFSTLNCTLHQENLVHILQIVDALQRKVEEISQGAAKTEAEIASQPKDRIASAGEEGVLSKLAIIAEEHAFNDGSSGEAVLALPARKSHKSNRGVVQSVKLRIDLYLEQVGLELTCRRRSLASLKVKELFGGVVLKNSYTDVMITLRDIIVTDMNPANIHTRILSIVGDNALNCQVVLYNLEETHAYNSDDMKINVEVGCMKIVFINWFVTSVLQFLNNFQAAQQAIAQAGAAAADAAKQNAIQAYEKATRMKLNIKVKAPIIIVPMDSQSREGIAVDLGQITLTNVISDIEVADSERSPAVLDETKLMLNHMKISKVAIVEEDDQQKPDSVCNGPLQIDSTYGLQSDVNILDPISLKLIIKRNLSFAWFKEMPEMDISGRLKSIELNLYANDYGLIMSILNRNLKEGADEFPPIEEPAKAAVPVTPTFKGREGSVFDSATRKAATHMREKLAQKKEQQQKSFEQFKFNFQFDGVVINMKSDNDVGLARFGLYFLSLKGNKLLDETLSVSLVLCNVQIEDTRPDTKCQIRKYLCRKDWMEGELHSPGSSPKRDDEDGATKTSIRDASYMVDLTAIIKDKDTFAKVRVYGFDLILCIDFLLKLTTFFQMPDDLVPIQSSRPKEAPTKVQRRPETKDLAVRAATPATPATPATSEDNLEKINLTLLIDEPDIILIESLEDMNSNAIIFNLQGKLMYRGVGEKQIINGHIDGLKMYMCSFLPERREATRHYILHPCVINLQGSTPESEGLHVSLKFSEIILNVSPATIELFNKAMLSLNLNSSKANEVVSPNNYSDIWNAKKFKDNDHWFVKVDQAEDAFAALETSANQPPAVKHKTERCILEVPSIMIVLEAGVGYYTTPLISMDMHMNAVANDWSSDLSVNGSLTLSMNYYNQSLAVWEPIIEEIEHDSRNGEQTYLPWELNFSMAIESKKSDFDDNVEEKTTKIKVQSDENLEVTVSKTCLDLLGTIQEAFSQAIDASGLYKPDVIAPYILENDTGFDISINFKYGIFTLHECHTPTSNVTNVYNSSLVFQAEDCDANFRPEQVKCCTVSAGGRLYMQTKDLSCISHEEEEEYNIYVMVGDIKKEIVLPVSKSDKRYFPLFRDVNQDPWGIISEVNSQYGTTIVNIHSVVNVHNHFTTMFKVYRQKHNAQDFIFVGEVGAGQVFHVPLHAIYSDNKYLYFCPEDYKVSVQGIKWDDSPTDLNYMRQVQCDPVNTFEPFYINLRREKTEVFHEHSNKYKLLSAYYTIHLRPPLYLHNALPINIRVSVGGCSIRENGHGNDAQTEIDETDLVKEDLLQYGEKDVDAGNVLHLPTMKMAGRNKGTRCFLVVRMTQYLERDWSCTTEISENQTDTATWKFSSYDSDSKISMDLCARFEDRQGSLMITLFSPFWLINKTGLMLSYKTDTETVEVLYHPPEYNGPILFAFREKYFFDKKSCSVRVDNGEWSKDIPLDVAGSTGCVVCKSNDMNYLIGVHNHLTYNSLTKQITFIPFYMVINKCSYVIEVQEQSRPADVWIKLQPDVCEALWPKNDSDHMLVARVDGQRTVPFKYSEVLCTLLKLNTNQYGGINVDVQTTEGGVYITFTEYYPGDAPGLLINHTSTPVIYQEKNVGAEHVLQPHEEILYTWEDPAGSKQLVFGKNKIESDLRRDGVGQFTMSDDRPAYWVSFLDGLQRVLLFTEIEQIATKSETSAAFGNITQSIEVRIHGIGISVLNNETGVDIMYLGITSSGIIWEYKKEGKKRFKQMNIHDTAQVEAQYQQYLIDKGVNQVKTYYLDSKHEINFDAMVLTKNGSRTIQRTFYPGVWVLLQTSPFQTQLHTKINHIQLDNQLTDCIFPVVLAPIPPPKTFAKSTHLKPFVECSIVERLVPNSTVKQYKYASMLVQEFHFKVDLIFLSAVAELFTAHVNDAQAAKLFNENVESIAKPLCDLVATHSLQEQKNYYDNLHLGPLKIHISFSMAGVEPTALPGVLSKLVQGIGVTLTDVNDVVMRLAFFEREYRFFTQQQLVSEISSHYMGQALKQLYVLVLGLDVLGNPYGLVVGIKKGVEDLFYEPFQGAIQGPGEFAEGLVLGVRSLFGHTVGGAAGAVSKITGAMGKGLAALTFDDDYQKKRRQALNKKPRNFQEGMARSGKGLVMGFVDGVSGCVTKPITGAREEGVEGFFKGLGKGTIGLVTRPTAGIVDFASGTFDSVKRATEMSSDARRLRPARFQHDDNVLRPYCRAEAKGNQILKEIEKGKYASTDSFIHAEEIVQKHDFVLVSNHRVIYITKNDVFGSWTVQWTYLWNEIARIASTERGVEITLKKEGKKMMGLFSTHEPQHKIILLPEKTRRDRLAEIMTTQHTG